MQNIGSRLPATIHHDYAELPVLGETRYLVAETKSLGENYVGDQIQRPVNGMTEDRQL
ncbi:hypothetical protein [Sphingomonas sp. PAMC26645]|uniref:hypothetical protein n=1 Tax=Sphingomonas sp. PAMC26645 TaxID=2565555 RepID=UPI0014456BD5|nr:hypothetical protein [Sphingomonas sp. PAMC26645]